MHLMSRDGYRVHGRGRIVGCALASAVTLCSGFVLAADLIAEDLEGEGSPVGSPTFSVTEFSNQTLAVANGQGVTVPHGPEVTALSGDFGFAFWFRVDEGFTGQRRAITFKGNTADQRNLALWMEASSNRIEYRISSSSNANIGRSSVAELEVGQWHHIAYVRRSNRLELYINGRRDSFVNVSGSVSVNDGPLYLGSSPFDIGVVGQLAEVTIFRRTLSALEVLALYVAHRPDSNLEEQGVTVGSPTYFSDAQTVGTGVRLNVPTDGVRLPSSITTRPDTDDFGVGLWVRLEQGPTGVRRNLVHKGDDPTRAAYSIWVLPNDNRVGMSITTDQGTFTSTTNASLPLNQWTHVGFVERGQLRLYVNGVRDRSLSISGTTQSDDGPLHIGRTPWGDGAVAAFDDVTVYNYRLEDSDMARFASEVRRSPAEAGQWGPILPWPQIPVSAANLPDGRVLTFSGSERTTWPRPERTYSSIWDPNTGEFEDLFQAGHNMFCAHLAMTELGQVFVNGGRNQLNSPWTSLFDYRENRWTQIENMASGGRWYPVTNALPNGEVITSMGTATNLRNPEKWSAVGGWSVLNGVDYVQMRQRNNGTSGQNRWWAVLSVAPSGELFHYWNATENHFISTDGTGQVRPANANVDQDEPPGVAIQYDAGRMIISGGNQGSWRLHGNNTRAFTIDLNPPTPVVRQTGSMNIGRTYHNLVPLPNGEVIALGGSTNSGSFNNRGAVYQAEIWNPQTGQWRVMAPAATPRNYHSTALLLTDGRVFSGGGGYQSGSEFPGAGLASHQNVQLFTPPYLFDANNQLAERPAIISAPGVVQAGQSFEVTVTSTQPVARFSMVRMGATTHAVNTDSRFVWVPATDLGQGRFQLTAPASPNVLIPGYWMLFALDANDVPSVAHVVRAERPLQASTPGQIRFVRLVALSEVGGNPWATVAELNLRDGNGDRVDRSAWQVAASSAEPTIGLASFAFDGDAATLWQTEFSSNGGPEPSHPHTLTIDLRTGYQLTALDYLPRDDGSTNGRIGQYRVEVSSDGQAWTTAADGTFPNLAAEQSVPFTSGRPRDVEINAANVSRYVRLTAFNEVNGRAWTTVAELNLRDADGQRLDRSSWQVTVDSEEPTVGVAGRAIDGNSGTIWHTEYSSNGGAEPPHPHFVTVDLGSPQVVAGLDYLPRQDMPNGRIGDYQVETSVNGQDWAIVASGTFPDGTAEQQVSFGNVVSSLALGSISESGAAVHFAATGGGAALEYTWAWGDGNQTVSSNQSTASHVYAQPGRYVVVVTVRDPVTGEEATQTFIHLVYDDRIDLANPDRWMGSTSVSFHPTRNEVWNVNPDNNTVSVVDGVTGARLMELAVEERPVSLAFDSLGRVWVSNKGTGALTILDGLTGAWLDTVVLPNTNARPHGVIIPRGLGLALVALEGTGELVSIDTSTLQVVGTTSAVINARHLSLPPGSRDVFVTSFITPPVPGESTLAPDVSRGTEGIAAVDPVVMVRTGRFAMNYSSRARTENSGPGLPNYLGAPAVHPTGDSVYIPSKQDNILGGTSRPGGGLTFDQAVRAVSSHFDVVTQTELVADRIEHDNASIAASAVYGPFGLHLFTALEGNRQIAISVPGADAEIARFDVGRAPQGLALSADGLTLAVHNFMDRTVELVDVSEVVLRGGTSVESRGAVSVVVAEALDPVVLAGKQLFYDARDDRLAALDYMACASCHEDGGDDGRVWDFTQFGEGLRNTQTLRGRGGLDHGLLHWTGNFDEVQDFEGQIRMFAGGSGLMDDLDFAGARTPFGPPKSGFSADLDALSAYVGSLKASDGRVTAGFAFSADGAQGADLYHSMACVSCHGGNGFTDSVLGRRHDIGTIDAASGLRDFVTLDGFDTPSLLGLATTPPYLHDGSAATVQDAIAAHTSVTTTSAQRDQLATYLLELSSYTSGPLVQSGGLSFEQAARGTWVAVTFPTPFGTEPVVVVSPATFNGGQPGITRIRNVTENGFEVQFDEWSYLDGYHVTEDYSYLAVVPGEWWTDNGQIEIQATQVDVGTSFQTVTLPRTTGSTPVVFAQVASARDTTPVAVRVRNVGTSSFQIKLEEEEALDQVHTPEVVNIITLTTGDDALHGIRMQSGVTPDALRHPWYSVSTASFAGGVLGQIQTYDGGDTSALRLRNLTDSSFELKVEEEQSRESETNHTTEVGGWLRHAVP